jgi:hypothetical protein
MAKSPAGQATRLITVPEAGSFRPSGAEHGEKSSPSYGGNRAARADLRVWQRNPESGGAPELRPHATPSR